MVAPLELKVAETAMALFIVTWQVPVPEHPAQLQPANVEIPLAEALSVTVVPAAKLAAQVAPQLMPAGDEVTVPPPVPALSIVSEYAELVVDTPVPDTVTVCGLPAAFEATVR